MLSDYDDDIVLVVEEVYLQLLYWSGVSSDRVPEERSSRLGQALP